jgi:hypothetical protein
MLVGMDKTLIEIVAANVRAAMAASAYDSYRALGRAAGVAPNTVRNLAEPGARVAGQRGEIAPRLDNLDKIARAMGYQGWQLMLANFDPGNRPSRVLTKSEADWYAQIRKLYSDLPPDPLTDK